jgi:hypothetical protein
MTFRGTDSEAWLLSDESAFRAEIERVNKLTDFELRSELAEVIDKLSKLENQTITCEKPKHWPMQPMTSMSGGIHPKFEHYYQRKTKIEPMDLPPQYPTAEETIEQFNRGWEAHDRREIDRKADEIIKSLDRPEASQLQSLKHDRLQSLGVSIFFGTLLAALTTSALGAWLALSIMLISTAQINRKRDRIYNS